MRVIYIYIVSMRRILVFVFSDINVIAIHMHIFLKLNTKRCSNAKRQYQSQIYFKL